MVFLCLALALLAALPAAAQDSAPRTRLEAAPDPAQFALQPLVAGLRRPLFLTHAGDGSGRLFIMEQGGIIHVTDAQGQDQRIFLDVSALVSADANSNAYTERGLLGLAFHPDYARNGTFFINYTDRRGTSVVARYQVSAADANSADPNSAEIILTQTQPFPNHNGGHMAFGPEGYLYISLGDGGAAGDPLNAGQDLNTLLGKILRIDVNGATGYSIPADNPFVAGGGLPEIWAYGLRNVWRFSFDRATGDLYLADVGQNQWEEINFQAAGSPGGENYGWKGYEASTIFDQRFVASTVVAPVAEYEHGANGCSVTGGYVYRGAALPALDGAYLYGDYCTGRTWLTYRDALNAWQTMQFQDTRLTISSFGQDEAGELYVVDYSGSVYRLVAAE
ncbi:MAG: PQQ-dependent sugar dehydrogenase [Anaerolineae bacterium]|jgi:glucose/arabinose dehydrogenase|nr:PQQ-dependent sugar dehydrogenase [Anaerolineae bacterium]